MEIHFDKDYLSDLFYYGKCFDKKHRFQEQIIKKYIDRINTLESVDGIEELYRYNSLHFEALQGDKKGEYSIRINLQYRIEFTVEQSTDQCSISICNILDLSNHYE